VSRGSHGVEGAQRIVKAGTPSPFGTGCTNCGSIALSPWITGVRQTTRGGGSTRTGGSGNGLKSGSCAGAGDALPNRRSGSDEVPGCGADAASAMAVIIPSDAPDMEVSSRTLETSGETAQP
jgi:hypothetical protein